MEAKKCERCGADIVCDYSKSYLEKKRFCSGECWNAAQAEAGYIRRSSASKQCPQCGKVFTKEEAGKGFDKQICCSVSCQKKLRDGPVLDRLQQKFKVKEETGCWEWQATINKQGYGRVSIDGRNTLAHRAVYELLRETVPEDKELHHKCFNPRCCNPDHLQVVTKAENNQKRTTTQFTPEKVRLVRRAFRIRFFKMGQRSVAKKLGVSRDVVRDVVLGKTWRNVQGRK